MLAAQRFAIVDSSLAIGGGSFRIGRLISIFAAQNENQFATPNDCKQGDRAQASSCHELLCGIISSFYSKEYWCVGEGQASFGFSNVDEFIALL